MVDDSKTAEISTKLWGSESNGRVYPKTEENGNLNSILKESFHQNKHFHINKGNWSKDPN
jgi:hypothetical protein